MTATCEAKLTFDNASLFREYPNLPRNENKKRVLSIAIPRDYTHTGKLTVSAWRPADTLKPIAISHETIVETHVGIYPYEAQRPLGLVASGVSTLRTNGCSTTVKVTSSHRMSCKSQSTRLQAASAMQWLAPLSNR